MLHVDYNLKIDKPVKKAKKPIQFYLEEAKEKQSGRITLADRARICETRIESAWGAKREGLTNLIKMTFKMNFHVWSSNGILDPLQKYLTSSNI